MTAGGKNVAPAVLEDRIRAHPLVSQCMVVGDGKPFVAALVTHRPRGAAGLAARRTASRATRRPGRDPDLLAEVQTAVDEANAAVSRAEAIRKFAILPVDWTEETGELTPTLKLKRDCRDARLPRRGRVPLHVSRSGDRPRLSEIWQSVVASRCA